ncbi:hypothetical protein D3C83_234090 [compost metagenome]
MAHRIGTEVLANPAEAGMFARREGRQQIVDTRSVRPTMKRVGQHLGDLLGGRFGRVRNVAGRRS